MSNQPAQAVTENRFRQLEVSMLTLVKGLTAGFFAVLADVLPPDVIIVQMEMRPWNESVNLLLASMQWDPGGSGAVPVLRSPTIRPLKGITVSENAMFVLRVQQPVAEQEMLQEIATLSQNLESVGIKVPPIIVLNADRDIEMLPPEQMEAMGWVRVQTH